MRTLTGLLVVALLVPALAGAANGEPKKALTKKDQATAHSVVVKRSDLGQGFTAMARDKNQTLPKGARCGPLDESDLTVTGDAASPDFRLAQPDGVRHRRLDGTGLPHAGRGECLVEPRDDEPDDDLPRRHREALGVTGPADHRPCRPRG
jgi:hypothetical protein